MPNFDLKELIWQTQLSISRSLLDVLSVIILMYLFTLGSEVFVFSKLLFGKLSVLFIVVDLVRYIVSYIFFIIVVSIFLAFDNEFMLPSFAFISFLIFFS